MTGLSGDFLVCVPIPAIVNVLKDDQCDNVVSSVDLKVLLGADHVRRWKQNLSAEFPVIHL